MAKALRVHERLCCVKQSYSLDEILASVKVSTILDFKVFSQCSDFYAFMLVVNQHISEKETELGRMVKAYFMF